MKLSSILFVSLAWTVSAGKSKLRLPDTFEVVKGETAYDCVKRSDGNPGPDDAAMFEFKKLKKFVGPFGGDCHSTFRCRLAGGECMTRRKCKNKGPGYKFRPKLCGKKPWDETVEVVDALEKLGEKMHLPTIDESTFDFGRCGCCVPPEDDDELETWGCAPADYTACAYAPTDEAGCESHGDKTGDLVCAWDSTANQCIGCTSVTDEAGCAATANCEWRSHDGKCAAKGTTTSPETDSDGNDCE